MRLNRALEEVVVDGIDTTLPLFRQLVREADIIDGNYHIHWLEQFLAKGGMETVTHSAASSLAACHQRHAASVKRPSNVQTSSGL